jgi:hypothetical protein
MAGDEDEAEEVVAYGVVESGVEVGRGLFEGFEFAAELLVFAVGDGVAAEHINGASFGGGGKPRGGIIGDAGFWPLFECGYQSPLCKVFCQADVASEAGEPGDDARGLDAPDGFDGAMQGLSWVVMGIGSGHCYRSHHLCID